MGVVLLQSRLRTIVHGQLRSGRVIVLFIDRKRANDSLLLARLRVRLFVRVKRRSVVFGDCGYGFVHRRDRSRFLLSVLNLHLYMI